MHNKFIDSFYYTEGLLNIKRPAFYLFGDWIIMYIIREELELLCHQSFSFFFKYTAYQFPIWNSLYWYYLLSELLIRLKLRTT